MLGATLSIATVATAGDDAGMRVYRDPATGEFTGPPDTPSTDTEAAAPEAAARARALPSAPSELIEEPGTSAAGGVTLDLEGRFRSEESATIDAAGTPRVRCHGAESDR